MAAVTLCGRVRPPMHTNPASLPILFFALVWRRPRRLRAIANLKILGNTDAHRWVLAHLEKKYTLKRYVSIVLCIIDYAFMCAQCCNHAILNFFAWFTCFFTFYFVFILCYCTRMNFVICTLWRMFSDLDEALQISPVSELRIYEQAMWPTQNHVCNAIML